VTAARRRWRLALKTVLDWLLTALGVLAYYAGCRRWVIELNRHSPKVLLYHACDHAENAFLRGLAINTTPAQFAAHLCFLKRYYSVVPLAELLARPSITRAVALTFDDGFRSVYDYAWPLLREHRITATCYLATSAIGNDALLWPNELNWFLLGHPRIARPLVARRLGLKPGTSPVKIVRSLVDNYACAQIAELLAELRQATAIDERDLARKHRLHLEWHQIDEMVAAGVSFGNHTCSHPPLAQLEADFARAEIGGARAALQRLPGAGETLAYPFGSHCPKTREIALELGVRSLLEVDGVNSPLDPTRIGRVKVSANSVAVLFARMEVAEPIKWRLKRLIGRIGLRSDDPRAVKRTRLADESESCNSARPRAGNRG
jgi:peptidoglycan/xylan/chitin deacetylase (PgdA/CDA1 family)